MLQNIVAAAISGSSGVNVHLNFKFTAINVVDAELEEASSHYDARRKNALGKCHLYSKLGNLLWDAVGSYQAMNW